MRFHAGLSLCNPLFDLYSLRLLMLGVVVEHVEKECTCKKIRRRANDYLDPPCSFHLSLISVILPFDEDWHQEVIIDLPQDTETHVCETQKVNLS